MPKGLKFFLAAVAVLIIAGIAACDKPHEEKCWVMTGDELLQCIELQKQNGEI